MRWRLESRARAAVVAVLGSLAIVAAPGGFVREARAAEPSAAPADAWHDGVPPDGSFRVRGPVPFEAYSEEDDDPAGVLRTQGVRASQLGAFDGVTRYIATCLAQAGERRSPNERIEARLAQWRRQAEFAYRRPVTVGGLAGVEFQIGDANKTMRVRVFAPAERTCTLIAQWSRWAKPSDEDVARFLDSFVPRTP